MAINHTVEWDEGDRNATNLGLKDYGPLSLDERKKLSGYLNAKVDTIARWFLAGNPRGIILESYLDSAICQLGDTYQRRRMMLGALLGNPTLKRIRLYNGEKSYIVTTRHNTLQEALFAAIQLYDGNTDRLRGFRISKAWEHMEILPGIESPWVFRYKYWDWLPTDDSDPEEDCPPEAG